MFDSLLGKKFTNKCKHSMKHMKDRMGPIRRRKQATLRFLKKDIADLVDNGRENNAFGRIEALIIEINHESCYELIEQYCECISNQLPSLQKQRECPPEATEAVSTLIFAAARFPDLPELCDLRRVFAERYGGHLETSVSAEFVEKIQKKRFSIDKKLRLMQDIAHEFSVSWDCQAFEQKMTASTEPAMGQPKKGTPICNGNNVPSHASNARKEVNMDVRNVEIPHNRNFEAAPRSIDRKHVQSEPRDIHVVSSVSNSDRVEKTKKVFVDEPENVEPRFTNATVPPYVKPEDNQNEGVCRSRSPWAQEGPGLVGLAREAVSVVKSREERSAEEAVSAVKSRDERAANMVPPPPYTKPKGSKAGAYTEEHQVNGHTYDRSTKGEEDGFQPITPVNSNNDRPVYAIPPYVKPKANNLSAHDRSNGGEDKDYHKDELLVDEKPKPVSVRRNHRKLPVVSEFDSVPDGTVLVSRRRQGGRRSHNDDYDEGEKIRDKEVDAADDSERHVNRTPSGRRRQAGRRTAATTTYEGDCDEDEDEEEKIMDNLLAHYSKKGIEKARARPAELVVNAKRSVNPPGRAVSLPPEPISPTEAVKGPARAASMHPDMLSTNGGRVHPRLPDYDEMAARLTALRKA